MHTSVGLLALAMGLGQSTAPAGPWLRDYDKAQEQAIRDRKPLVVVVGTGHEGFEKLAQEGKLGADVEGLLENYVCVYLDRSETSRSKLIGDLSIKGQGIIISDRKGEVMAFHHDGTLSQNDLKTHLRHYANPALEIRTTQSHNSSRISYYPSASYPSSPAVRTVNC